MNPLLHFFRGFKDGMTLFGQTISLIINSILLLIVYLIGVGLVSLFAKAAKKDFLETEVSKKRQSYWSDLNLRKRPTEEYYRQF